MYKRDIQRGVDIQDKEKRYSVSEVANKHTGIICQEGVFVKVDILGQLGQGQGRQDCQGHTKQERQKRFRQDQREIRDKPP